MKKVSCKLVDASGAAKGQVELDPACFASGVREAIVYDVVRAQRNAKRAGTHSVLTKGVMKGGGKKPWRQKGTGRARAGSNTSPVWVGGAVAHGPKPRKYSLRTPKRSKTQALAGVLRDKALSDQLLCVESLACEKTSDFKKFLSGIDAAQKKVLFVLSSADGKVGQAARNIAGVCTRAAKAINPYEIIRSDLVLVSKKGLEEITENLKARE